MEKNFDSHTVFSFDIFDTIIMRKTATPKGIFTIVREILRTRFSSSLPIDLVEDFFEYRVRAEKEERKLNENEEITLDQIYERLYSYFHKDISRENLLNIRDIEIETEINYAIPIPQNLDRIHNLLDQGCRVILVSDMYLPAEIIRTLLRKFSTRIAELPLYLSGEIGKTKYTGTLFDYVCVQECIRPKQLHHLGDQQYSDIIVPKSKGIFVEKFTASQLDPIEMSYLHENQLFHQLCAGTSRSYRLLHPNANQREILGATLAAPLLYGFVEEVLRKAKNDGFKRLYFLARDGQILLKIAQLINNVRKYDFDLRYLYCARQVSHFASVFRLNEEHFLRWIIGDYYNDTLESMCRRLRLDPVALLNLLPPHLRKKIKSVNRILNKRTIYKIKEFMIDDDKIRSKIEEKSQEHRQLFYQYLEQEHFFDENQAALVDLGWTGKMQDAFYKAVKSYKPNSKIVAYYFIVSSISPLTSSWNIKNSYLKMSYFVPVNALEIITSADHGTTSGYERDENGNVRAVLQNGEHLIRWGIKDFQQGIEGFVKEYLDLTQPFQIPAETPKQIIDPIFKILLYPNKNIADTLGSIPFSGDQNDSFIMEVAPKISFFMLLQYYFRGVQNFFFKTGEKRTSITSWLGASVARSSWIVVYSNFLLRIPYLFFVPILRSGIRSIRQDENRAMRKIKIFVKQCNRFFQSK
ncbi:MAG: hypothetical protein LBQ50_10295 [Planctomycetaceae bacterium]|jgi:predicted HAD superfamily hydrolase|nr:hypothetical protein [Planctomycetaceae bacterium]